MGELLSQPVNLHEIPGFEQINVNDTVTLRPLTEADGINLLSILSKDPLIRDRVSFAANINSIDQYQDQLNKVAEDPGLIRYGIHEEDELVGLVSFWRDDGFFGQTPEQDGYGFGFFIDPDARGRGLITTSVEAVMARAEASLHVGRFMAFCEDDNTASQAVLGRLGFQPTGDVFGEPSNGWQERKYIREVHYDKGRDA